MVINPQQTYHNATLLPEGPQYYTSTNYSALNCPITEFKGKACQTEKCLPHSCMDRGNCIETENGKKKCQCSRTYAGNRCQYECRDWNSVSIDSISEFLQIKNLLYFCFVCL